MAFFTSVGCHLREPYTPLSTGWCTPATAIETNTAHMTDGNDTKPITRRSKGIYILPNMITLAALFGGFYAIVMSMNGRYDLATVGIFAAMVLDSLDGRVARLTNTQSAFGEQMDSLSDMVSFGAAPALIAYEWSLSGLGRWGWIAAFVYCACAALRLARFNVNTTVVDKRFFQGLPSPAAAALVAGFIWLMTEAGVQGPDLSWWVFGLTLFSGLTMSPTCRSTASKTCTCAKACRLQ